jgi:hypothetical protein
MVPAGEHMRPQHCGQNGLNRGWHEAQVGEGQSTFPDNVVSLINVTVSGVSGGLGTTIRSLAVQCQSAAAIA